MTVAIQKLMPQYQCHKKVWALKISDITPLSDAAGNPNGVRLKFVEPFDDKEVGPEFVARMKYDATCGYFVVYEDGYQSWSPSEAFENGYTRIEE